MLPQIRNQTKAHSMNLYIILYVVFKLCNISKHSYDNTS